MRRVLTLVGLAAILGASQVGLAGATEVKVPATEVVCQEKVIPAKVGTGLKVQKKITLGGTVLNANVNQRVIDVFKTIGVQVCVKTEGDVVAKVDAEADLNGVAECPHGAVGAAIKVPVTLDAGAAGGAVLASVKVAVTDEDAILGVAFDKMEVVIAEHKRLEVLPARVEDEDAVDADLCVGPV